jgi:hypothetical protein
MESDPPGRWASPSLLALRLTCRSVKWAVEAVARRGLFPQFELFTSVDRWLTSLLGERSEKRASLAHTLDYELSGGAEGVPDDGRARLRVEYMTHAGDFLGTEVGMGLESCLSLSLPGQPHGM